MPACDQRFVIAAQHIQQCRLSRGRLDLRESAREAELVERVEIPRRRKKNLILAAFWNAVEPDPGVAVPREIGEHRVGTEWPVFNVGHKGIDRS